MNSRGTAFRRLAVPIAGALALVATGGGVAVGWGNSLDRADSRARLEQANLEIVDKLDRVIDEFHQLGREIEAGDARRCSPASLEHFRRYLFDLAYLRDIGFTRDRTLLCSTALGVIEQPEQSSRPDLVLESGLQIYAFRPVRISDGRRTMVLQVSHFNALVDPGFIAGLSASPYVDTLHILSSPDAQPFALFEAGSDADAAMTATQCSAAYGYCVTAGRLSVTSGVPSARSLGVGILGAGSGLAVFLFGQMMIMRGRNPGYQIARAIRHAEFEPVYQPIFSLPDQRLEGVELLARWPNAPAHMVSPEKFIAEAEFQGVIHGLTEVLVRRAGRELGDWFRADPRRKLAINVSADELRGDTLSALLSDFLIARGILPSQIVLELTERTVAGERGRQLGKLADAGYRIYIDDLGEGYSSLSYLHHLPLAGVKISRSFTSGLGTDSPKVDLVQAMVELARKRELRVVLEGIETEDQHAAAVAMGSLMAQGFHYARPMSAQDLVDRYPG